MVFDAIFKEPSIISYAQPNRPVSRSNPEHPHIQIVKELRGYASAKGVVLQTGKELPARTDRNLKKIRKLRFPGTLLISDLYFSAAPRLCVRFFSSDFHFQKAGLRTRRLVPPKTNGFFIPRSDFLGGYP
jgi:hypothetical protein